jgi:hypothetical protein
MNANLKNQISPEYNRNIHENLSCADSISGEIGMNFFLKNNGPKPFRGWGRFKPVILAVDHIYDDALRLSGPASLKGWGRNRTFYLRMFVFLRKIKNSETNRKENSYFYWRGSGKEKAKVEGFTLHMVQY